MGALGGAQDVLLKGRLATGPEGIHDAWAWGLGIREWAHLVARRMSCSKDVSPLDPKEYTTHGLRFSSVRSPHTHLPLSPCPCLMPTCAGHAPADNTAHVQRTPASDANWLLPIMQVSEHPPVGHLLVSMPRPDMHYWVKAFQGAMSA